MTEMLFLKFILEKAFFSCEGWQELWLYTEWVKCDKLHKRFEKIGNKSVEMINFIMLLD